jgi:hypothetical protein
MMDFEYLLAIINEMRANMKPKIEGEIKTCQEDLVAKTYAEHNSSRLLEKKRGQSRNMEINR